MARTSLSLFVPSVTLAIAQETHSIYNGGDGSPGMPFSEYWWQICIRYPFMEIQSSISPPLRWGMTQLQDAREKRSKKTQSRSRRQVCSYQLLFYLFMCLDSIFYATSCPVLPLTVPHPIPPPHILSPCGCPHPSPQHDL